MGVGLRRGGRTVVDRVALEGEHSRVLGVGREGAGREYSRRHQRESMLLRLVTAVGVSGVWVRHSGVQYRREAQYRLMRLLMRCRPHRREVGRVA